jgi:hypothetical protein
VSIDPPFGHSDGGSIALIYAGSGLTPPTALILEAPHVFVEDLTIASIAEVRNSYRSMTCAPGSGAIMDRTWTSLQCGRMCG